jgi:hypothetical protein
MNVIARALVEQTAILELSPGPIDNDDTVKILESLATTLQSASNSEVAALRATLAEMLREETDGPCRAPFIKFYREFLYYVGIEPEPGAA